MLARKGVTLMLLWQEYQAEHLGRRPLQYSQFCERCRQYTKTLKRSMRQVHRAGEKLFVDYAGPTLALDDGSRASIFVSAMGASHYTYAQATAGQKTADWITGMTGALHFMGAVPELIMPDNPRAVIAVPDRYEPRVGDTVLDFARHYGCSVLPARPRTPQDKASVESAVQVVVERWILARLRHVRLSNLAAANRAIRPLLAELNDRPFQKLPGSRASVFATIDAPAMGALPTARYEYARFKTVRVAAALTRENLQAAFKQVRANKGAAGVDGLDIDQTALHLATAWPVCYRSSNNPPEEIWKTLDTRWAPVR